MENSLSALDIYRRIMEDEEFNQKYMFNFLDRFVYSITDIENKHNEKLRKEMINSLLSAFNLAMSYNDDKIGTYEIQEIANIINAEDGLEGFRKIGVSAGTKADWEPVAPNRIYFEMYTLLDNYYNIWVV